MPCVWGGFIIFVVSALFIWINCAMEGRNFEHLTFLWGHFCLSSDGGNGLKCVEEVNINVFILTSEGLRETPINAKETWTRTVSRLIANYVRRTVPGFCVF